MEEDDFELHNDPVVHDHRDEYETNDGEDRAEFSQASGTSTPTSSTRRSASYSEDGRNDNHYSGEEDIRRGTQRTSYATNHPQPRAHRHDEEVEDNDDEGREPDDYIEEDGNDVFMQRVQQLQSLLSDIGEPLCPRAALLYGPTERFSTHNILFPTLGFVFGPQLWQMGVSIVLFTVPTILVTVSGENAGIGLLVMTWLAWVATTVSLVTTGSRDPGIIPKRVESLDPAPSKVSVVVHQRTLPLRYCVSCEVYRGPRTHHCGICGNCVDQFDHHCPWTGTCIGARNYHWFLYFLHSLHLLAILLVACSAVATLHRSNSAGVSIPDALKDLYYFPIVVMAIIFLSGISVTGLLLFHWHLLIRNLTTAEFLKSTYLTEKDNPWDLGSALSNAWAKWTGWVDDYSRHWNYQCLVVREVVSRQRRLLLEERLEFYHQQELQQRQREHQQRQLQLQQQQQQQAASRRQNPIESLIIERPKGSRQRDSQQGEFSPRENEDDEPVFPTLDTGNVALYV